MTPPKETIHSEKFVLEHVTTFATILARLDSMEKVCHKVEKLEQEISEIRTKVAMIVSIATFIINFALSYLQKVL